MTRTYLFLPALLLALAAPASAQTWVGPNGSFQNAANWTPAFVPGADQTATYSSAGSFLSTFESDWTLGALVVNGGTVNFGLNGHTLTAYTLSLGNASQSTSTLALANGTLLLPTTSGTGFAARTGANFTLTLDHATFASTGITDMAAGSNSVVNVIVRNGSTYSASTDVSSIGDFGSATVIVDGTGSSFSLNKGANIGVSGTGVFFVQYGALLRTNGAVTLGASSGSSGTVILSGTGSSWTHTNGIIQTGSGAANAVIDLRPGTTLTATGIGAEAGIRLSAGALYAAGTVNVSGIGASGITVSDGALNITPGGAITTKNLTRSGAGVINLNGGTLTVSGGTFDNGGAPTVVVSGSGNPVFQLQNANTANVNGVNVGTLPLSGTQSYPGTLNVVSDSNFVANGAITAGNNGSAGNIQVDGSGSFLTVNPGSLTNVLLLGGTGSGSTGNLTVQNGGTFQIDIFGTNNNNATAILGQSNFTTGSVVVTGTGSSASLGTLSVGVTGYGTATVSGGGALTAKQITVGENGPGVGQITVTGAGSTLTTNNLYLGGTNIAAGGFGSLNVSSGGSVNVANGRIKLWGGGSMTINGGSVTAALTEILSGSSLTINGGGTLTTQNYLTVSGAGALNLNSGTLTVNGQGGGSFTNSASPADLIIQSNAANALATLQLNSAYTQNIANLLVGDSMPGALVLTNGAQVTATNVTTTTQSSGSATITLSGQGTNLTSTGVINIGGPANPGNPAGGSTLTVGPGSSVIAGTSLSVFPGSVVNLNGGTVTVGSLNGGSGGFFNWTSGTFGFSGTGYLDASRLNTLLGVGGTLTANHSIQGSTTGTDRLSLFDNMTVAGGLLYTGNLFNYATLNVSSGTVITTGMLTNNAGALILAQSGAAIYSATTNNGEIQLGGGGARLTGALTNNGRLDGSGTVTGNLTNNANGVISVDAGQRLVLGGATNTNNLNGTFSLTGGTIEFTGALTNAAGGFISGRGTFRGSSANVGGVGLMNNGVIAFSGGTSDIFGKVQNLGGATGGQIITSGGGVLTFHDDVIHNGQEIRTVSGSRTVFFGAESGAGNFTGTGAVEFQGDLRPGNSPASVSFAGDVVMSGSANLHAEIGGTTLGSQYDHLQVAGLVSFAGNLDAALINGFTPVLGQRFDIVTFGSRAGTFNTFSGLSLGNGLQFTPNFDATNFYLAVSATSAAPGQFTWTGSTSGSWNTTANWSPTGVPASSADTQLTFGGTANATMTNDIPGTLLLNSMAFNSGAPVYTLSGNGLNFQTSSGGVLPQIVVSSSNAVTIGVPLTLTNNLTVSGSGNLTVNGAIGGVGSLTLSGPGTLTLNAANSYSGGTTINAGTLAVTSDAALGTGPVTFGTAFATLNYTATTTTARSFTLNSGTLAVAAGQTLTLNGAAVGGGFLRGAGTFALTGGTTLSGATTFNSTTLNQTGAATFINVTHGGTLTTAAGQTLTWNGGSIAASGALTVNGTANLTDVSSVGRLNVNPGGVVNNSGSSLVLGGGSVTSIGIYNPVNGQVTPGGTISLGDTDMVIQGGLVRNNGTITSNNGNIIVDYGATLRGSGVNDVNSVILRNGGQRFSGNSPGPSFNRNVDLTNQGVTGVDISRATGNAGDDWGVYEYGATSTTNGRLTITGTPANKAIFKMETVTDVAPRTASAPLADFDPLHPYTWDVFRPGAQNAVAEVSITDALTNLMISGSQLNDVVLNEYLGFDASGWDWGTTPVAERGFFAFTFEPDTLGNANRVIALVYSPVPEPGTLALVGVAAAAFWRRRRIRAGH